jgi:CubicO group peptidase (beta-lactamase class C family)
MTTMPLPSTLPRSSPSEQQVDAGALLRVLDALEADPGVEMHSLMVVRHGHVVAEGWWAPYTPERPHLLYSVSKSFAMTAALIAQAEGVLELKDTVLSHFPELDADAVDPRSRGTTFEDLAAMASGHTRDLADLLGDHLDEPVRALLATPPDGEPGVVFAYNQLCTYSIAAAVQRATGQRLTEYLRPRLFDPLGIGSVGWQAYPDGREIGYSGLHARTEDIARLGQLYLQRGRWGDEQLIPEDLVADATRAHVDNSSHPGPADWQQGYGWQFWMSRHGFRGDGAFGQFCVVLPEHDVVVATTACTEAMQEVLDVLWTHLLPGLSSADPSSEEELAARLAGLAIPACPGSAGEPGSGSGALPVAPGPKVGLESVELASSSGSPTLSLVEPGNRITFPVGLGEWSVSEPTDASGSPVPVAASGGWSEGAFRAEVLFLETPHRLDVSCRPEEGRAEVSWRLAPLGSTALADLRCPR